MDGKEKEEQEERGGREPKDQSRRDGYVVVCVCTSDIKRDRLLRWSSVVGRRRHLVTQKKLKQAHLSFNSFEESTVNPSKYTTSEPPPPPP